MKNFHEYIVKIKTDASLIPDCKLAFWGMWFCEKILSIQKDKIINYIKNNEGIDINLLFEFLWRIIDKNDYSKSDFEKYYQWITQVDENDLDRTDLLEICIYELILLLDFTLGYLKDGQSGWKYLATQSTINIIDLILDYHDLDILQEDGFEQPIVQNEIKSQLEMIKLLTSDHDVGSNDKHTFANNISM